MSVDTDKAFVNSQSTLSKVRPDVLDQDEGRLDDTRAIRSDGADAVSHRVLHEIVSMGSCPGCTPATGSRSQGG